MQYQKTTLGGELIEYGELPSPTSTNPNQENIDAAVGLSKEGGEFSVIAGRALDSTDPTERTFNIVATNGGLVSHNLVRTP